jgi:hypothetical protein
VVLIYDQASLSLISLPTSRSRRTSMAAREVRPPWTRPTVPWHPRRFSIRASCRRLRSVDWSDWDARRFPDPHQIFVPSLGRLNCAEELQTGQFVPTARQKKCTSSRRRTAYRIGTGPRCSARQIHGHALR